MSNVYLKGPPIYRFTPLDIEFKRQAVRRLVFDRDTAIPLSLLRPDEMVDIEVEHPRIELSGGMTACKAVDGRLILFANEASESALWAGGFNPFATYDVSFVNGSGRSVEAGIEFASPDNRNRLAVLVGFSGGRCGTIRLLAIVGGVEKENKAVALERPIEGPFVLRVQMLGSGLNVFTEQREGCFAACTYDFSGIIDLRRKEHIRTFEFRLLTRLGAGDSVTVSEARAFLGTGVGQADIRAITYEDGSTFLDRGRLWFTMSVRGRRLPHSLQGVFSMNPSVFDLRLEGLIVFDREDGLLRNEMASHIFFDREARQWRGLTVGFSAYGDSEKKATAPLWAVSSQRDPRFGFSIMSAKPVVMPNAAEDPHIIYDRAAAKWRVLVCSHGEVGFPATLFESDHWDGPYMCIAGPAGVNGTGCQIQWFGSKAYCLFGSSDRKFYVYSYPDLRPLGALNMFRPPWGERRNTRCWPNVVPLPDGYPAPYIALSMDRANYPGLDGWNYGALYLYHGHPRRAGGENVGSQDSS